MATAIPHMLPNGLLVLTREVRHAPIISCWLSYRVGSRNETNGLAGISHCVEHMLFAGTPSLPRGSIKRQIARFGGTSNAFTSNDYTAYYATVPADRIDMVLRIEADRMINSRFTPEDVELERKVIVAERARYENTSTWWLREAMLATTFNTHPYRQPVIGTSRNLQIITREQLYQHYQAYYQPNNGVMVLVGDFTTVAIMRQVMHAFGAVPSAPVRARLPIPEPAQREERRVVVRRPITTSHVQVAYRTPGCQHPDFAPLMLLDAILSGTKTSSFDGGVRTYRSSRLYRALVETQFAGSAHSNYRPTVDPRLFEFSASVQLGRLAAEVESALMTEIERIQQDGVSDTEVATAGKQFRAQMAYAGERVASQAWLLGMWAMLDSYTRADLLLDELLAVRAQDIQRVAQTYLIASRRTIGQLLPISEANQSINAVGLPAKAELPLRSGETHMTGIDEADH